MTVQNESNGQHNVWKKTYDHQVQQLEEQPCFYTCSVCFGGDATSAREIMQMFLISIMPILAPSVFSCLFLWSKIAPLFFAARFASANWACTVKRTKKTQTNHKTQHLSHYLINTFLFGFPDCQKCSSQSIVWLEHLRKYLDSFPLKGFKMGLQLFL